MIRYSIFILAVIGVLTSSYTAPTHYRIRNNALVLSGSTVTFDKNTSKISSQSDSALKYVLQYLKDKSYITVMRVEGHVAPGPGNEQVLSQKRALAVCQWLVSNGIDCSRLMPVGFGTTKPIADNSTAEGRAINTRIEFVNAALRSKNIGGKSPDGGGSNGGDPCK